MCRLRKYNSRQNAVYAIKLLLFCSNHQKLLLLYVSAAKAIGRHRFCNRWLRVTLKLLVNFLQESVFAQKKLLKYLKYLLSLVGKSNQYLRQVIKNIVVQ